MKSFFALGTFFCLIMGLFIGLQIEAVSAWEQEPEHELVFQVEMESYKYTDHGRVQLTDLEGQLLQYLQKDGGMVSVWQAIDSLHESSSPVSRKVIKSMLHKPMLSRAHQNDLQHFIGNDFPSAYLSQQLHILNPLLQAVLKKKLSSLQSRYDDKGQLLSFEAEINCPDSKTGEILISKIRMTRKSEQPRLSGRPFLDALSLPRADLQRLSLAMSDKNSLELNN